MESSSSPLSPLDPSLSRELHTDESSPRLSHSLHELHSSVLSLAASDKYVFSGSQNEDIAVWCKKAFTLKDTLRGHSGSILALEYVPEREWLLSSSGDSTIRVWNTVSLKPVYVIDPYLETGAGDLFSLAWSNKLQTIYIGCQNTSLQWIELRTGAPSLPPTDSATNIARKAHKFFDSYPQYERKPADIYANNAGSGQSTPSSSAALPRISIPVTNVVDAAHYGYIYSLAILEECDSGDVKLVSGSGDETIKVWDCSPQGPVFSHDFGCHIGAVFALVTRGDTIYGGCQDGIVKVLDIETRSIVRTIIVQEGIDILSLTLVESDLYVCSANGRVQRYSASFDQMASWQAHSGIVLSSLATRGGNRTMLLTGGNDDHINIWDVAVPRDRTRSLGFDRSSLPSISTGTAVSDSQTHSGSLEYALSKFIAIPSVSSSPSHREDCRQAGIWLKKCLGQLGATTSLIPTGEGKNPLVLGSFSGVQKQQTARKPRILFYGHYDVMAAPSDGWNSDPFSMTGRNGYLYGRGVTDDKGPIIATAFAAAELLSSRKLAVDLVFLIEGEEECGSTGFEESVRAHKDVIGNIDAILVSNSTWISESNPCITYGLRGVVHCDIEIASNLPDLHSGVDGGGLMEPMDDMIQLLATLTNRQKHVKIPNFYDRVRECTRTEDERILYATLAEITGKPVSLLASRWTAPSLTVHNIESSGPQNATVIPGTVRSQVSIRIVPDQKLETIAKSLRDHLTDCFADLGSPNTLKVDMKETADWWLGQLDGPWFSALESAVQEEWGVAPLRIREGGSIPSIPYLEKEFGCHALHLPMGQSSDQAHLPNERISLSNLHRGKSVIERFLLKVAEADITKL